MGGSDDDSDDGKDDSETKKLKSKLSSAIIVEKPNVKVGESVLERVVC